jgi:predicted regulator of Ras-like GTPase activity (Roadblock/LC7/MglB family)
MSNYTQILKNAIVNVKHCQRAIVSTSDGLLIESYPESDDVINDTLSAATSSIYGITTSVSARTGKHESDYILIKNPDSFILVYFVENVSLMMIADSRVNLGMLLHVGRKLKNAIGELQKESSYEQEWEQSHELESSQELEDSTINKEIVEESESAVGHAYDKAESADLKVSKSVTQESIMHDKPGTDYEPEEEPSFVAVQQEENESVVDDPSPIESESLKDEEENEFHFSDEDKLNNNESEVSDGTSSVTISFNDENGDNDNKRVVDEETEQIDDDIEDTSDPDDSVETDQMEDDESAEENTDSYQSFASWRERMQRESDDEDDSSKDGLL